MNDLNAEIAEVILTVLPQEFCVSMYFQNTTKIMLAFIQTMCIMKS